MGKERTDGPGARVRLMGLRGRLSDCEGEIGKNTAERVSRHRDLPALKRPVIDASASVQPNPRTSKWETRPPGFASRR